MKEKILKIVSSLIQFCEQNKYHMKRIIIIWFIVLSGRTLFAQDLFQLGLKYYEQGQYFLADSVFKICTEKSKPDLNLWFNYASTRLYLKDTSTFCSIMWNLGHQYNDKEANSLFFKFCGSCDTSYYNNDFVECEKRNARYTEIIENHKYNNYKMCFLHDKKGKEKTIIKSLDFTNLQKSDIIAQYKLLQDSSKLYLFTTTPPTYVDGYEARMDYINKNPFAKEAKDKLMVNKLVVGIKYIIDSNGVIRNIEITDTNKPVADLELLKKYVDLIIINMPKQTPGKFRDEYVDFSIKESISIW